MPNFGGRIDCRMENFMEEMESSSGQDGHAEEVLDSVGVSKEDADELGSETNKEAQKDNNSDPLYVQKRLKQAERKHAREMRELMSQNQALMQHLNSFTNQTSQEPVYDSHGDVDGQIQKAVSYALNYRDMQEQKQREAENARHIERQHHDLDRHLDNMSNKYDDFDEIVRGNDVPFTHEMRTAALLLPKSGSGSAGEVLYKLGKNREDLSRISKLHPVDQARELVNLSHAMIAGKQETPKASYQHNRPMESIKTNPLSNPNSISEKTSVSEIRRQMKEGRKAGWR